MNRPLLAVLLSVGLAGCAVSSDIQSNYALDVNRSEGLAIVSLTLSGKPLSQVTEFEYCIREVPPRDKEAITTKLQFGSVTQHARSVGKESANLIVVRSAVVKGLNSTEPLDVLDAGKATGRLLSLRLPAGEYEFNAWKLMEPSPYGAKQYGSTQAFSYRFSVMPGEAVYLGRLRLHLNENDTHKITVEDRREVDLATFRKKYPSLDAGVVGIGIVRT